MNELPLRDIHLPDAVSWWPPAPGWWLLPLIIALLAFAIYKAVEYRKIHRKIAYKKIALKELNRISQQQEAPADMLREISSLLRRIALSYLPRESTAGLTGDKWIEQLNQLSPQAAFSPEINQLLTNAAYRPDADFDKQVLISHCENWIKNLPDNTKTRNTI